LLAAAFGSGGATKSGATVTVESALQVSVVMACVRVIAEGVAQVPFRVMRESPDGRTRVPAKEHPLYDLLNKKPNRWQTSFGLRETMVMHAALTGDGYAFKSMSGKGKILELIVIPPNKAKPLVADNGEVNYEITGANGQVRTVPADLMWHLRGPSWDGVTGMKIITMAREAIGLAMATEETQANLHAKGVKTSGVYSVEGTLNKQQYEDLKKWISQEFTAGNPMILDHNAKWLPISMSGVDAQHLETRKHQVEEICRMLRVMPIMAGQADKASTYASAEQMFIAHLVHTLTPWYERVEQSADCQLLTDKDREEGYYTFLDPVGMLRGALKDTAEYLYKLVSIGLMTRNEGREKLDLNPVDGLDEPLTPMNLITSASNDSETAP
jgi:HK97 family phage portal protein